MKNDSVDALIHRLRDVQTLAKLVGRAPSFLRAISRLPQIARGSGAVLIAGETGTGKELVARAVHFLSPRAPLPFVPVNCGAVADTLLEDELFGHEVGAFTDARGRRTGLIAQADKGTLFLDEVDALSPRAQVSLLRVLQDQRVRPLGGGREEKVDVRFVAATNASLLALVTAGRFRQDLYYRLCLFCIELPALRDRREDILTLAHHFLAKYAAAGTGGCRFSAAAETALLSYDWPGNIRELENVVARAVQVGEGETLDLDDLALAPGTHRASAAVNGAGGHFRALKQQAVEAFERDYLARLMVEHGGNVTWAAHAAGKDRRDFGRLLKKYGLNPPVAGGGSVPRRP